MLETPGMPEMPETPGTGALEKRPEAHKAVNSWDGFAPPPWNSNHSSFSNNHSTTKTCVSAATNLAVEMYAWVLAPPYIVGRETWKHHVVLWEDIILSHMVSERLELIGSMDCSNLSSMYQVTGGAINISMCCHGRAGDNTMSQACRVQRRHNLMITGLLPMKRKKGMADALGGGREMIGTDREQVPRVEEFHLAPKLEDPLLSLELAARVPHQRLRVVA